MSVTVVLSSHAPGGIDVVMWGLLRQTCQDFDVAFVDERYSRRHRQVLVYLREIGFQRPFYHVPPYQKRGPWDVHPGTVINTGLVLATGSVVALAPGHVFIPPDWVELHLEAGVRAPRIVTGTHRVVPPPQLKRNWRTWQGSLLSKDRWPAYQQRDVSREEEVSIFLQPFDPGQFHVTGTLHGQLSPGPAKIEMCLGANMSFPLGAALAIGGASETGTEPAFDFARRLIGAGCEPWALGVGVGEVRACNIDNVFPRLPDDRIGRGPSSSYLLAKRKEKWTWRELSQLEEPILRPESPE